MKSALFAIVVLGPAVSLAAIQFSPGSQIPEDVQTKIVKAVEAKCRQTTRVGFVGIEKTTEVEKDLVDQETLDQQFTTTFEMSGADGDGAPPSFQEFTVKARMVASASPSPEGEINIDSIEGCR